MIRKAALVALVMLTAVLLQTTVFARTIFGVAPDIVLLASISFGLLEGPLTGAATGSAGGLLRDLLLNAPKGVSGFAYLVVGYATGRVRPYIQSRSVLIPVVAIALGTFGGTALYEIVNTLLGDKVLPFASSLRIVLLTSLYNMLLAPFLYPLIRKIVQSYQREQVVRW